MSDEHIPQQPVAPGYENETCGYCGQKGHWSPDCNLKGSHEFKASYYDWPDEDRIVSPPLEDLGIV